ncbi:Zn(II)2Cys6 transcription factor domain-containing protein [Aspergillus tanneri]|uniref:Zn(2)-C6 fungal-type domain-containing protein n=1 Tax=Aspergillus tanneri TaxID=1220188 RepID=A0A5M9MCJ5_9EURO|nr:uncharacterized protein ATNIH1004_008864 [Aspergillus tanneri]KAA8644658.1 hypothetical protein ATNIH1004_008864 [Aspergillus tanneri]
MLSRVQRSGGSRSRTGCRTCRARHVKCDETPGACKKCTSTGRRCDYDLQRLPHKRKPVQPNQLALPELTDGFQWSITSDEGRCFSHFQFHTLPNLLELSNFVLWQNLVLQISYTEPAVYHAAVSLSAAHQNAEIYGIPLPGQDINTAWYRFAVQQSS